ncbi:MAG: GntR family transcriptional regulator [Rhodospirillum sp.]|nr:GntR family transcriptional regulator [Rhodospirillum sp.]MCF8490763.1 GntR family transcriptional regulator [Rhodospirillum sp.]MCF8502353.1 GntR family transcriptional regulator [Rhodospirillum sp.]
MNRIRGPMSPGVIERPSSVTDQVFAELYHRVISLVMPPGTKTSETEVASALGVSRQPVRDAFYRLSKAGFLAIRPQRATTVSMISERAVKQARFIRTALEVETTRVACERLTEDDLVALESILDQQQQAVHQGDKMVFHELDDMFHREICERAGVGYVWRLIQEHKAHMDRVRFLSLSFASQRAYDDHIHFFEAIRRRDAEDAVHRMRLHMMTILEHFPRIRAENPEYFDDEEPTTGLV